MQEILVQLGEVNHAIDDIIGYLNQMEEDLNQLDKIYGDPGHVILHLRKIQVLSLPSFSVKNYAILRNYYC